jgi:YVTN family beta-propeller protein
LPWALCHNPQNNKVYCANEGSGNVTVIDGATDSVIATVTAGSGPWALCHNPQNNKVYCANEGSDDVTVIDGTTNHVLRTVAVGDGPSAFCHNPQENRVYVTNYGSSSISVLRDSAAGVEETTSDWVRTANGGPTVVRGVLTMPA